MKVTKYREIQSQESERMETLYKIFREINPIQLSSDFHECMEPPHIDFKNIVRYMQIEGS